MRPTIAKILHGAIILSKRRNRLPNDIFEKLLFFNLIMNFSSLVSFGKLFFTDYWQW